MDIRREPTSGEELANALSHGAGLVGSMVAAPFLLSPALNQGDAWSTLGMAVFVGSMILLYLSSTVYHALPPSRTKQVCRVVDHCAIFVLIAGSYTPFALGVLRGAWGWTLLGVSWAFAGVGLALKLLAGMRYPSLSTTLYLVMGWMALVAFRPISQEVPAAGLLLLLAGGLAYTGGVAFYLAHRLPYHHLAWHLCVLAGTTCHALAIAWYAA